jgi:aminoglycoside/choline kinase family phosphotransferase/GTP:adenosylcobinamide-phosphate guanylyltransferase
MAEKIRKSLKRMRGRYKLRDELKRSFLTKTDWAKAALLPFDSDASFRKYDRLSLNGKTAFLMDSAPVFGGVKAFIDMADYLLSLELSAPVIYAQDQENGFLIIEDLGEDLYSHLLKKQPKDDLKLYRKAVGLLAVLSDKIVPDFVASYSDDFLLTEIEIFTDWYMPSLTGVPLSDASRSDFLTIWGKLILLLKDRQSRLVLRDYHADNLIDLPEREGAAQVGLLDFQDALKGHAAYDLVSLLKDIRRDVSPQTEAEMLKEFISLTQSDATEFTRDYHIIGLQRNIKILGIFTRLDVRDGKKGYAKFIPKLWGLIESSLGEEIFEDLRKWLDRHVSVEMRRAAFKPQKCGITDAFILAAGLGTRMRPLTDDLPKPLIEVAGRSMLSRLFDHLGEGGVKHVTMNMHHKSEKLIAFAEQYPRVRPSITLSDESSELLDSGGGVKRAVWMMRGQPFFILNGDFIIEDQAHSLAILKSLSAAWQPEKMDILMLVMPKEAAYGYEGAGDFNLAKDGKLTPRSKGLGRKENPADHIYADHIYADHIYTGIMIIKPEVFKDTPEGAFSLRLLFDKTYKEGTLYGLDFAGKWYHVGRPDVRNQVEEILEAKK